MVVEVFGEEEEDLEVDGRQIIEVIGKGVKQASEVGALGNTLGFSIALGGGGAIC